MRQFFFGLILACLVFTGAVAAPVYPQLTGRVVDDAHLLSPSAHEKLEQQLAYHEKRTGEQLVVFTLPTLAGRTIEEYSVDLFRHWQLGQKGKNNGALLLIAVAEHEARIEVGYGLEGDLTDAMTSQIIRQDIVPSFQNGNPEMGIMQSVHDMLTLLGDKDIDGIGNNFASVDDPQPMSAGMVMLVVIGMIFYIIMCIRHPELAWFTFQLLSSARYSSGGGGGGGGFSGGGGSSGGGGASGKW